MCSEKKDAKMPVGWEGGEEFPIWAWAGREGDEKQCLAASHWQEDSGCDILILIFYVPSTIFLLFLSFSCSAVLAFSLEKTFRDSDRSKSVLFFVQGLDSPETVKELRVECSLDHRYANKFQSKKNLIFEFLPFLTRHAIEDNSIVSRDAHTYHIYLPRTYQPNQAASAVIRKESRRFDDIIILQGMRPGKTTHIFEVGDYSVKFSGNFDGGNLRNVVQTAPFQYELESAFDSYQMPSTSKIFFHFYVHGFPPGTSFQISFCALALLATLKQDICNYRPFRSDDGSNYHRMEEKEVEIAQGNEGRVLKLHLKAIEGRQYLSFALPYSYERYLNMIRDLPASDEEMYIHKEVLCYSNNLNLVYAISISSQSRHTEGEEKIGEDTNTILFPEKHLHPPKKYIQKPVILISSRVHPGETPASWAVEGILHFLTSQAEEAKLIRKNFQVVVVPMLNPDGVEEGLYRLDTRGHNLNRYYLISDNRQPSIYGMKHLIQHYHTTKRLLYYFDFHGHPSQKGSFLYGNALDQLPYQVETQLFARLMALNCPTFEERFCIFDRAQMNSKDKYDQYTKEGCARVFAFKVANILHSYTIELGFHGLSDSASNLLYSAQDYYRQGRQILSSVLMTCGLKQLPQGHTLHSLRRQLAAEICSRDGRFKREERNISQKKQKVNEIVENGYWKPIFEQHFTEVNKLSPLHGKRLRAMKKDSLSTQLQSFFSEDIRQIAEQQIKNEEKEDRTSLGDLFEETKAKIEATNITFKLHRTNFAAKSSHTTKTDFEQPPEKSPGKLAKIMVKGGLRHLPSQPFGRRQKFRSLRKAGCEGGESRMSGRDEEHMFGDLNIRSEGGLKNLKKNKIHSLFIETHD